jgi:hypothetical protein
VGRVAGSQAKGRRAADLRLGGPSRARWGYFSTNAARMDYSNLSGAGTADRLRCRRIGRQARCASSNEAVRHALSDSGGEAMLARCAYLASNRRLPVTCRLHRAA